MSTKTLRKRIALVAVSAMGFGLLTSVAANAAGEGQINALAGSGKLAYSSADGQLAQTATFLANGVMLLRSTNGGYYTVSGGSFTKIYTDHVQADPTMTGIDADGLGATLGTTDDGQINISSAAGTTVVVKGYADDTMASLVSKLTVTVASASVAGVVSAADSSVAWVSDDGEAQAVDEAGESSATTGNALFLSIQLNDAYGSDITATTGALVVTVSSGATVKIAGTAGNAVGSAGTFATAVSSLNPSDINAYIAEATDGAGWNGTVTVTYNGTLIATKSGKITGAPSKIVAKANKIGGVGAVEDTFTFTVQDAAGNFLDVNDGTYDATDYVLSKTSDASIVSSVAGTEDNNVAAGTTSANGDITCVKSGSADVSLQLNYKGTIVKSNTWKASCAGNAVTYKASFDKASYIQGEIAKLTVTFYDIEGNVANSNGTITTADGDSTISAPMLVRVGGDTILAATKPDSAGQVVHTFTVGTSSGLTDGSYNAIVNYAKTLTDSTPQTVSYKVSTGAAGVTNAEVLAAIVKLIASINKQIAALQKALKKK